MQLTTQMLAEIESIETRVDHIDREIVQPMLYEFIRYGSLGKKSGIKTRDFLARKSRAIIAELNPYKVRLENILCETDKKEQGHSH